MTIRYFNRTLPLFTIIMVFWSIILMIWLLIPSEYINLKHYIRVIICNSICSFIWLQGLLLSFIRQKILDKANWWIDVLALIKKGEEAQNETTQRWNHS